jgi:hypothetical protein
MRVTATETHRRWYLTARGDVATLFTTAHKVHRSR